ncbi:MAG: hypothetical protein K8S25_07400, partial [Alphaproteobacteria bacterium]|nr:hypothetical protein [Alphaproteobacteria bacterium]
RAPWLDPRSETPVPDGLISGCPEDWQVMGNAVGCDYGDWAPFFGQTRVMHTDLNKDNGPVGRASGGTGTTRRGMINGNFARAVGAAIEDTRDKWAYFKERLVQTYGEGPAADIVCVLERDAFDPAACAAQGQQAKLCSARESADAGKDPSVQQPSADEIATAEALWPDLHLSCRTEESDLARQAVLAGGQADQGRARGKVAAIGLLALWNACPAQAARRQASLTGTTPSASRTDALTSAYAGCILAARLHQLQK